MIKYEKIQIEQEKAISVTCDVCKKEYQYNCADLMEAKEFQHIRIQGGYGSVFGDGAILKTDICQHCFKKIFGEYLVEDDGQNEM